MGIPFLFFSGYVVSSTPGAMKVLCLFVIAALSCANGVYGGNKWALLVAGSRGYWNYRHQADVAHSYQLLLQNGLKKENIVVMMYDDVANSKRNPFKGNLINVPNGPNVYEGLVIDYRMKDVSPKNFLNVLQGNASAMNGIGSGRVINSNSDDHVFVYYTDHGNRDIVAFPYGGVLHSKPLLDALNNMNKENKYHHLVFYMEACYSGSMFRSKLPNNINVWAITAANDHESSYACFYDRKRRTYLGDLFSVDWMLDTEKYGTDQTLDHQFNAVKKATRRSHVCSFGDKDGMGAMKISDFIGERKPKQSTPDVDVSDAVRSWDVPYMTMLHQLEDAKTPTERLEIMGEMMNHEQMKLQIRESLETIASKVTSANPKLMFLPKTMNPTEEQDTCYEYTVARFLEKCYSFDEYDYAMKDLHMFSNLCNQGVTNEKIFNAIDEVCAHH